MYISPLISWDIVSAGAPAWTDDRKPLACDVPRGVELRVEPGTQSNPIIVADRPWEEKLSWAQTMVDDGRYRMWYGVLRNTKVPREIICYAEEQGE